jgi:uncharacterized protein (DUF849 family)
VIEPPPILLHGVDATAWSLLEDAASLGCDVRIGLEDTLWLPDGEIARSNADLILEARRRLEKYAMPEGLWTHRLSKAVRS